MACFACRVFNSPRCVEKCLENRICGGRKKLIEGLGTRNIIDLKNTEVNPQSSRAKNWRLCKFCGSVQDLQLVFFLREVEILNRGPKKD